MVKIVHPGGRIELHERPMVAEEIMLRNTGCFVTHPHVFSDPWAVVAPDEVLMLGQKFYVVPISTIKKLQRHHLRRLPSSLRRVRASKSPRSPQRRVHTNQTPKHNQFTPSEVRGGDGMDSLCWIFTNKSAPARSYKKQVDDETDRPNAGTSGTSTKEIEKQGSLSEDSCFKCLLRGAKTKTGEDLDQSTRDVSSESNEINKKTGNKNVKREMKDVLVTTASDHWQPGLESINEEHPY